MARSTGRRRGVDQAFARAPSASSHPVVEDAGTAYSQSYHTLCDGGGCRLRSGDVHRQCRWQSHRQKHQRPRRRMDVRCLPLAIRMGALDAIFAADPGSNGLDWQGTQSWRIVHRTIQHGYILRNATTGVGRDLQKNCTGVRLIRPMGTPHHSAGRLREPR